MFIAGKVGIAALATGVGFGVPYGFWALQQRDEPRMGFTTIEARDVTDLPSNEAVPLTSPSPVATAQAPEPVEATPAAPPLVTELPQQRSSPVRCGGVTCPGDHVCCNASCGICVAPGGVCTDCGQCESAISEMCGLGTCNSGQICCNASCGICARPSEGCSHRICDRPTIPDGALPATALE